MNCLIFNPYGNLEGEGWKEYRSTMLAKALVRRAYKCTIYAPPVEHRTKQKRDINSLKCIAIENGYDLCFSWIYMRYGNRSVSRVFHEFFYAISFLTSFLTNKKFRQFTHIICVEPAPFCSWLAHVVKAFTGVVLVYDVLDLFPEIIETTNKRHLNFFKRPLKKIRALRLEKADGVVYCSRTFREKLDVKKVSSTVVYLGYSEELDGLNYYKNNKIISSVEAFLERASIKIIYAGSYGDSYGLDKFIKKIKCCLEKDPNIKVCLFGLGDENQISRIESWIGSSNSIYNFGSVSPADLNYIYSLFDVGVISYSKGTSVAMPVKFFDYIANKLYVINNCPGEVSEILEQNGIGANFDFNWKGLYNFILKFKGGIIEEMDFSHDKYKEESQYEIFVDFLEKVASERYGF